MFERTRRVGAMLACAGIGLSATQVSAAPYDMCFDETTAPSVQIHQFQTMMMVGSLKCRNLDPTSLRRYGDFVTSRSGDLARHTDMVREAFNQRYGEATGTRMFRLYETSLGNEFSGIEMTRASCQDLGTYARMAERADHADIATISGLATNRAVPFCPVSDAYAADEMYAPEPPLPVAAPAPAPAHVAVASPPAPPARPHEAEYAEIVEAPVVPIADETQPASVEPAVAVAAAPADNSGEDDARLAQAIEALDNAANALRAMRGGS